jgi:hypothetical protein
MKKLLAVLIALTLASPVFAVVKKEVKKHKKAEASGKVADDKGTKPVAPSKKKK